MMTLLIIVVVVLGAMAVAQLARVYELTSRLRGKREEEVSESDNRMNARLMWLFCVAYFGFFLWLLIDYRDEMLPVSASEHGVWLDNMMDVNWAVLFIVFFITNALLFWFAGRYYQRPGRTAFYYPHNNKLEIDGTVIPAVVMIGIIIYGLLIWNRITGPAPADALQVELYAKQFDWTARYPGEDGVLGATDYRLINDNNPLGIVTEATIATRLQEMDAEENAARERIKSEVLPEETIAELEHRIEYLERMAGRVIHLRTMMEQDIAVNGDASAYAHGSDDIVVKEFHLPVRNTVKVLVRSRDVIHSVFIPHLRAQMNAVPGMSTTFHMVPTITTDSMRTLEENPAFDFILLCNKICGASHYNMQMALTVEHQKAYDRWLAEQKPFEGAEAPPAAPADSAGTAVPPTQTAEAIIH
jgi:cytochrome c oxidase subunit 2